MPELFSIRICICVITGDSTLPLHFDYFIDLVCLEMLSSTSSESSERSDQWSPENVGAECRGYRWSEDTSGPTIAFAPDAQVHQRPYISLLWPLCCEEWRWTLPPPQLTSQKRIDCWRLLINGLWDRKMPYFWIVFFPKVMYKEFSLRLGTFCPVLIFWVAGECPNSCIYNIK